MVNLLLNSGGALLNGKPVIYLTQWQIVGNSEVHTDPYLTSWKVSGNSVVDNNTILSCGDLGQDGKYHVKISNGTTIYDIPLTEPLRKVNDVADTIEFPSDTEGKALVTRNLKSVDLGTLEYTKRNDLGEALFSTTSVSDRKITKNCAGLIADITRMSSVDAGSFANNTLGDKEWCYYYNINSTNPTIYIRIMQYENYTAEEFASAMTGKELIYELATPTTKLVDVSPFPVSPTDSYTSANTVPYSAFEHTENKEIWSCGEYNATDGKYHILVQPLGGNIADIALDEPLRKVNDVADNIEFPSSTEGKALITRLISTTTVKELKSLQRWNHYNYTEQYVFYTYGIPGMKYASSVYALIPGYTQYSNTFSSADDAILDMPDKYYSFGYKDNQAYPRFYVKDYDYSDVESFIEAKGNIEVIYELATPTTELVDAPQIQEAESYTCVISQGSKAVSWSSFEIE